MGATIYDVSKLSGVSTATVSRAYSRPEAVKEITRKKIFAAAEVLHYSPNAIARAMAKQRTDRIAYMICKQGATILDEFYAGIADGIMSKVNQLDYQLLISTGDDWQQHPGMAQAKQLEGVILAGNAPIESVMELRKQGIAVVLVNNRITEIPVPCVVSDELGGVYQVVERLTRMGHRRITMLAGRFSPYILQQRYYGFLQACEAFSVKNESEVRMCDPNAEDAAKLAMEVLSQPQHPTAIFAGNDVIGAGVIKACRRLGLRVPQDVAVIGYDNASFCGMLEPELTTVHTDCHRMGELSVERLISVLNGDSNIPAVTTVPAKLKVRASG